MFTMTHMIKSNSTRFSHHQAKVLANKDGKKKQKPKNKNLYHISCPIEPKIQLTQLGYLYSIKS